MRKSEALSGWDQFFRHPNAGWLSLVIATSAVLFWPALSLLAGVWKSDPDSSHGIVIPFLSAYLIWRLHKSRPLRAEGRSLAGLAALLFFLALYLVGIAGGLDIIQRVAMIGALHGAIAYNGGAALYRRLLFPLLFLFLMFPLPTTLQNMVSFPLQIFATTCSRHLLWLMHVPVIQAGNILHTPRGALEVAEACSGLRSLMAFLTISLFIASLSRLGRPAKIFLVFSTVPIALVANILRITSSALLGFVYSMALARGYLHELSGFILFLLGLGVFLLEAQMLEEMSDKNHRAVATGSAP